MSEPMPRSRNAQLENLVSNLRGEVGDIIFTWSLMRIVSAQCGRLRTADVVSDMENPDLSSLYILVDRLKDEIIARLSDLAEMVAGRLTFHFAQIALGKLEGEVAGYARFMESKRFREKRDYDRSHTEHPDTWIDYEIIPISYRDLVKGIALALRLMKKIDRIVLGPNSPYLWREARKSRYTPVHPVRAGYMMLPYLRLSETDRAEILHREMAEGTDDWVDMETTVDGVPVTVKANKAWGAILYAQTLFVMPEYPLRRLERITTRSPRQPDESPAEKAPPP